MSVEICSDVSRSLPSGGGTSTVEVEITPLEKTRVTDRQVVLLIDTSGSMVGSKIESALTGTLEALDELDDDDYVGIVGFDADVDVVLPMQRWGDVDQQEVKSTVDSISAGGGTDIYKGLETARDQLDEVTAGSHVARRIILLSDGQDRFSPSTYRDLGGEIGDEGIAIMATGIGTDYDEAVMLALAEASGGSPNDIEEADIEDFLNEAVKETETVIASNPELRLDTEPGFIVDDSEPVYFDAPGIQEKQIRTDGDVDTVPLPELQVDEPHRLTFEVIGQPKAPGLTYDLARLELSADSVLAEDTVEIDYLDEPGLENARIEKARANSKVTLDIRDSDVKANKVQVEIEKLEDRGWTKTAATLRDKLDRSDEPGGIIHISKERIDEGDD